MPFQKFRPIKQFGRYNTLMFRDFNRRNNLKDAHVLQIDPEIKQAGIKIQNPLSRDFFKQFEKKNENAAFPLHLRKKSQGFLLGDLPPTDEKLLGDAFDT
uniref:Uncharacterized protein n=1 Tax=Meloidogyne floridensis TaxID=298350 RepID=A0A915P722_9BILA